MSEQQTTPSVQWGKITLYFDNDEFRKGYAFGREMYFDHVQYHYRTYARRMTSIDAASAVADDFFSDGTYHFDEKAYNGPLDILGAFLGYMSGPLYPETPEERAARSEHWCMLPG